MSLSVSPPMASSSETAERGSAPAWYCLRSQPKHEHIVAAHLRKMEGVELFLPRIRFQRATRQGMAWVTEPLFPGYLFCRFVWDVSLRRVQAAPGARGIVHFGEVWPVVTDGTMEELHRIVGAEDLHTIDSGWETGDEVFIAEGTLRGLRAVVSRVMPGRERVAVLMELLGQQTEVELPTHLMVKEGNKRVGLFY